MSGLFLTIFVYILGGLTFLPLILCGLLAYVYLTCPYVGEKEPTIDLIQADDGEEAIQVASANLDEKFKARGAQENDVSSGYFAVSREYVPGGVGAKPPERTTPTGSTTISSPSPSVYQSMYRSLFDRKPSVSPIDNKGAQRPIKKGGNIFYVVLRCVVIMSKGIFYSTAHFFVGIVILCFSMTKNSWRSDMSSV